MTWNGEFWSAFKESLMKYDMESRLSQQQNYVEQQGGHLEGTVFKQ
jgi:hypothetical protein